MDCCLLSDREVGRLTHYGILPNHDEHVHIDSKAAIRGVMDDTYNLIEGKDGRYHITRQKMYFLRRTPSGGRGGIDIIQRVLAPQPVELMPLR